jgi:hypothetical protein
MESPAIDFRQRFYDIRHAVSFQHTFAARFAWHDLFDHILRDHTIVPHGIRLQLIDFVVFAPLAQRGLQLVSHKSHIHTHHQNAQSTEPETGPVLRESSKSKEKGEKKRGIS